jgi:signal transduction histidine kinase
LRRAAAIANLVIACLLVVVLLAAWGIPVPGGPVQAALAGPAATIATLAVASVLASLVLVLDASPADADRVAAKDQFPPEGDPERGGIESGGSAPTGCNTMPRDLDLCGLMSSMQHDLRTPLNAIIGFSDIMQQELHGPLGSDRYHSYAGHIRESGIVLLGAIESTLALTLRLAAATGVAGDAVAREAEDRVRASGRAEPHA